MLDSLDWAAGLSAKPQLHQAASECPAMKIVTVYHQQVHGNLAMLR